MPAFGLAAVPGLKADLGFCAFTCDFVGGIYGKRKSSLALAEVVSNTQSANFVSRRSNGYKIVTATNQPRRSTGGIYCEAAATNLITQPRDFANSFWTANVTRAGGFPDAFEGLAAHRLTGNGSGWAVRITNAVPLTPGQTYTWSQIVERGNFDWFVCTLLEASNTFTNTQRTWWNLSNGTQGSTQTVGAGIGYVSRGSELITGTGPNGGPLMRMWVTLTATSAGLFGISMASASADLSTTRANVGSGAGIGDICYLHHAQLEAGSQATSPIISPTALTRPADQLVLKLPTGTHTLTLTFDDDTTQVINNASGNYALNPASVNRRRIKAIKAAGTIYTLLQKRYAVADYVEGNPTWTDNTVGLQEWLDDAFTNGGNPWALPAGTYALSGTISKTGNTLPNVFIVMDGVELVWTNPTPLNASFRIDASNNAGGAMHLRGGRYRLNRPSIRTGNVDLIQLDGYNTYEIHGTDLASSDNMGISVGRRSAGGGYICSSFLFYDNLGGTYEHPDSRTTSGCYGPIGDTLWWLLSVGHTTLIYSNHGKGSGDDLMYLGNNSFAGTTTNRIQVFDNIYEKAYFGFGTSYQNVDFYQNTISKTYGGGMRFYKDSAYDTIVAHGGHEWNNTYTDIGLGTKDDIGAFQTIAQVNAYAIWFRGRDCVSDDANIDGTLETAIRFEPAGSSTGAFSGVRVNNPTINRAGVDPATGLLKAWATGNAVFRRATGASTTAVMSDFKVVGAVITNTNQPLLSWPTTDGVDASELEPLSMHVASLSGWGGGSNALIYVTPAGTGRAYWHIDIVLAAGQATPSTIKTVSGGASNAADVQVNLESASGPLSSGQIATLFRLKRAARRAAAANPVTGVDMASPPTITSSASHDAAFSVRANWVDTPNLMRVSGGNKYGRTTTKGLMIGTSNLSPSSSGNLTAFTNLSPALVNSGEHQLCYTVEFMALAQVVELELRSPGTSNPYRIIVDDQFAVRDGLLNTQQFVKLDFGSRASRRITVEVGIAQSFLGVSVISGDTITAPTDDVIRIVGTGDSHTEATTAGVEETTPYRPWDGWLSTFGKRVGSRSVRNAAVGATGYWNSNGGARLKIAGQMDYWVLSPNVYDVIAFAGGYNDTSQTSTVIRAEARAAWEKARVNQPNALIVVLGVFGQATGPSASILAVENALKAEFDAWADPFSMWIPVSTDPAGAWITGTGRVGATNGSGNSDIYVSSDGVHPSRAGRLYAGQKADEAYRVKLAAL